MRRGLLAAVAALLLPAVAAGAPQRPPRLAVVLVVDQFGFETLQKMRRHFGKGGFERLLTEGAFFTEANYGHLSTYTGPGHALLASGSYGYKNGIVANKFYDRGAKKSFTMLFDPAHPVLEATPDPEDDSSPANFVGETVGDRLRLFFDQKSKVVSLATKDRAAVLLGGRLGQAYWFSEQTGKMTTSTWYTKELPAWVKAFNDKKLADAAFEKSWERALPEKEYLGPDDPAYESDFRGLGKTFPHVLNAARLDKPAQPFYEAFTATPFANDLEVAFARAAVEGEGLGKDDSPDLLAISFTATDYAGHAYGPESHEVQDLVVRLDRNLAELLTYLERAVGGRQNLLVALAADHGGSPVPEHMAEVGHPAGRLTRKDVKDAMQAALKARFGDGDWVLAIEEPSVYLNEALVLERKLDPALVQDVAGQAALKLTGMNAYFTRAQLTSGALPPTTLARAAELSFFAPNSGDVLLVSRPFFFWGKYGEQRGGSSHGSPWRFDTHVPVAFWGYTVKPGAYREPIDTADFAPTLAALLGLTAPAMADGHARPEVFR